MCQAATHGHVSSCDTCTCVICDTSGLSYSLFSTLSDRIGGDAGQGMNQNLPHWDEDAFWRKLILPQEDRQTPLEGKGYRWFRSPNVIPIEQWRRQDEKPNWRIGRAKR